MAQHDDIDTRNMVKTQRQSSFHKKQSRLAAVRQLLSVREGRELIWHLFQITGLHTTPFNLDSNVTAFKCGELNIGNQILALVIEANPEGYITLMKDQANDRTSSPSDAGTSGSASIDGDPGTED
jgi:hypothetical protein